MSFSPMLNVLLLLLVVQLADRTFTLQQKEFLCLPYRLSFFEPLAQRVVFGIQKAGAGKTCSGYINLWWPLKPDSRYCLSVFPTTVAINSKTVLRMALLSEASLSFSRIGFAFSTTAMDSFDSISFFTQSISLIDLFPR